LRKALSGNDSRRTAAAVGRPDGDAGVRGAGRDGRGGSGERTCIAIAVKADTMSTRFIAVFGQLPEVLFDIRRSEPPLIGQSSVDAEMLVFVTGVDLGEDVSGGVSVGSGVGGPGVEFPVGLMWGVAAPDENPEGLVDS
jgi:hypothetical protein